MMEWKVHRHKLTLPSLEMASEFLLPATTERTRWEGRALTEQTHSLSSFVPIPNWPSSPEPLQYKKGRRYYYWRRERTRERERVTRQWCWKPWEWLMVWRQRLNWKRSVSQVESWVWIKDILFENNSTLQNLLHHQCNFLHLFPFLVHYFLNFIKKIVTYTMIGGMEF